MISKQYQDTLRAELNAWFTVEKIRFYPNSVTVTLKIPYQDRDKLYEAVDQFVYEVAELIELKEEQVHDLEFFTKNNGTFRIVDRSRPHKPTPDFDDVDVEFLDENGDVNGNTISNKPVNSREELLDMLREAENNKHQTTEQAYFNAQIKMVEEEIVNFLKVNVDHVLELLPTLPTFTGSVREDIELALKFGFIAGKWSQASLKDMTPIMEVWAKHFPGDKE